MVVSTVKKVTIFPFLFPLKGDFSIKSCITTTLFSDSKKNSISNETINKKDKLRSRSSSRSSSRLSPKRKAHSKDFKPSQNVLTTTATTTNRSSRKGLDLSPAMLEFFSGKSSFGPSSCFEFHSNNDIASAQQNSKDLKVLEECNPGPENFDELRWDLSLNRRNPNKFVSNIHAFSSTKMNRHLKTNHLFEKKSGQPGPEISDDSLDFGSRNIVKNEEKDECERKLRETNGLMRTKRDSEKIQNLFTANNNRHNSGRNCRSGGGGVVEEICKQRENLVNIEGGHSFQMILIRGAQIVNDDSMFFADVLIEQQFIKFAFVIIFFYQFINKLTKFCENFFHIFSH